MLADAAVDVFRLDDLDISADGYGLWWQKEHRRWPSTGVLNLQPLTSFAKGYQNSELRTQNNLFRSVRPGDSTLRLVRVAIMRVTLCIHIYSTNAVYLRNTRGGRHSSIHSNIHCLGSLRIIVIIVHSSSFPHLFPLLCGVDVSYETPPFSTVVCVLP